MAKKNSSTSSLVDQFNETFGTNKKLSRNEMLDEVSSFFGSFGVDIAFVDEDNKTTKIIRTKKPRRTNRR